MSPWEWSAVREALKQATGLPHSSEWFPMDPGPMQANPRHYQRAIEMTHPVQAADELQRGGAGFFDTLKHGFHTVVKHARTIVDHGKKASAFARGGVDLAMKLPVIGKYAEKGDELLKKVEAGLEVADKALKAAEFIDSKIARGAGDAPPAPNANSVPYPGQLPPSAPVLAPKSRSDTNNMALPGAGFAGAGLMTGGSVAGGSFGSVADRVIDGLSYHPMAYPKFSSGGGFSTGGGLQLGMVPKRTLNRLKIAT